MIYNNTQSDDLLNVSNSSFEPKFEGPIKGYVINFLRRNFWRVQRTMEYEDVLQEAHLMFLELKARYPTVDTPQWFMTLFVRSWYHRFADLSTSDSDVKLEVNPSSLVSDEEQSVTDFVENIPGDPDNTGMLMIMIKNAPEEVRRVVNMFMSAPVEVLDLASRAWKDQGKKKEFGDQHLAKLLGLDVNSDVIQQTKDYFSK